MIRSAEARDRAAEDNGAARRIGDTQLAAAGRREEDIGSAAGEDGDKSRGTNAAED
jgi:hypothetical protein